MLCCRDIAPGGDSPMTYVLESTHEIVRPEYKSRLIMQNILTGVQEEGIEVTIPEYRTPAGTWTLRTSKRDALDMVASGDW